MKLTINGITIRQDAQGRYLVNDLHRAEGNDPNHRPSNWLRNQDTKETIAYLVEESKARIRALHGDFPSSNLSLENLPIVVVKGGRRVGGEGTTGTWIVWELVYDYAMWVSPAFKIKVIRAYNQMVTRPRIQHEKSLIERYPFYPDLREGVLQGKTDTQIAPAIGRSAGSVRHHRVKQFDAGYTDPLEYAHKRYSPAVAAKVIAKRGWDKWGSDYETPQGTFNFEFGETE